MEPKPQPKPPTRLQNSLPFLSLAAGCLSAWPYLTWMVSIPLTRSYELPSLVENFLGIIILFIVPCNGIPFGLAGMLAGAFSIRNNRKMILLASLGILASLVGCIGNITFFLLL